MSTYMSAPSQRTSFPDYVLALSGEGEGEVDVKLTLTLSLFRRSEGSAGLTN